MKLLMVDDDRSLLSALHDLLVAHDHVVDCCDNAEDAIKMVPHGKYDFVLIDYRMPGNDGIWFMKNVKLPRHTKALLMTAYVNREVINKMFSLGACGYIIKPFDDEEILRHIEFYKHSSSAQKPPPAAITNVSPN